MDSPWEYQGISYPANWLRLSTQLDRDRLGIVWEPDPEPYDQRFYWGPGLPKDHAQLVQQWVAQTRTTAGTLLTPTDWMVVRELDNGTAMAADWKTWRQAVRTASEVKVAAIEATADTDALAAYITGADYPTWPASPDQPAPLPADPDGLQQLVNDGSSVDQVFG
jgi:hypothetical protein